MGEASITSASRMREKERGITVCRLADSFKTNSYNKVPPMIMELMKDMKGFSDIISKCTACDHGVDEGHEGLLRHHLQNRAFSHPNRW